MQRVIEAHYTGSNVAIRLVSCLNYTQSTLAQLNAVEVRNTALVTALISADSAVYDECLAHALGRLNAVYDEFVHSEDGAFVGDVYIVGDCLGGLLAHDLLVRQQQIYHSPTSVGGHAPVSRHASSVSTHSDSTARQTIHEHEEFTIPELALSCDAPGQRDDLLRHMAYPIGRLRSNELSEHIQCFVYLRSHRSTFVRRRQ
jgi:hypothetical protein